MSHANDIQKQLTKKLLKQHEERERARNPDVIRRTYNPPVEHRVNSGRNRYWRD